MKNPFASNGDRPSIITVGPFVIKIFYPEESGLSDNANDGITLWDDLTILVDGRIAPVRQADVLMHEILHCIARSVGMPSDPKTTLTEEDFCLRFSAALVKFVTDNPHVIRFFRKVTKG